MTRARPDGSKDSTRGAPTPPLSQNLFITEDKEDVDSTDVYTSDEESHGANAVHPDEASDEVDSTEYYSDGLPDGEEDTPQGVPPTPPRPREEAGAFRVILDHDEDLDLTEYFTESEDEGLDNSEWLEKYTQFPLGT